MYYTQSADAWKTFATEIFEKIKDKMSGAITNIALSYAASTSRTEAQQAAKTTTKFTGSGLTTMQYVTGGASATNDETTLTITTGDTSGTMTMKFYDANGNRLTLSKGQRIEIVFHGEFDPTKAAAITGGDEVTGLTVTATAATVTIAATMARAYGNTALTIPAGTTLKITAAELSQINDSTDITWSNTVPAMTDAAPYLWAKITATLSDGSTKEIAKVCYESLSATSGGTSPTATPDITASATVDSTSATTPSVTVTKTGTAEAPSFTFAFSGLKGEKGDKGETGATGATGPAYTLTDTDKSAITAAVLAQMTNAETTAM